jgi:hypothetical protein
MIMLALVVFGTLAMTTSYSDLKLSRKSVSWIQSYYELDSKGENFIKLANDSLDAAQTDAMIYLDGKQYLKPDGTELNAGIQTAVYNGAQTAAIEAGSEAYANLFRKLFCYFMLDNIEAFNYEIISKYDFINDPSVYALDFIIPETGAVSVATRETIKTDNDTQNLDIQLDIVCMSGDKTNFHPYCVTSKWNHVQKQFNYDNNTNIWNGKVGN